MYWWYISNCINKVREKKDGKVECKVHGSTLNTCGQEQLNFDLLKQNVIDEVTEPEEDPREMRVHNPHKIKREHQNIRDRRRNEAIQSRLRQTRRWPQHLLIVSLWLRNTVHCPRRRPKSSPGCSVWWRRHDEHRTLVRSGLNKKCVFSNHVVCRLFPVFDDVISCPSLAPMLAALGSRPPV